MERVRTLVLKQEKWNTVDLGIFGDYMGAWIDNGGEPGGRGDIAPKFQLVEGDEGVDDAIAQGIGYFAEVVYLTLDEVTEMLGESEDIEYDLENVFRNVTYYDADEIIAVIIRREE